MPDRRVGSSQVSQEATYCKHDVMIGRHEVAYALGQKEEVGETNRLFSDVLTCCIQISAVPVLTALLKNDQDSMVLERLSIKVNLTSAPDRSDMKLLKR